MENIKQLVTKHYENIRRQSTIEILCTILKTLFAKKSLLLNDRFEISISSFSKILMMKCRIYRQKNVLISGVSTTPPNYTLLNDKMAQLVDWYQSEHINFILLNAQQKYMQILLVFIHSLMVIDV